MGLDVRPLINPPIGKALALDPPEGLGGALGIVDAQRHAVVVAEIELGQIAVQVLLGAVLIVVREESGNR